MRRSLALQHPLMLTLVLSGLLLSAACSFPAAGVVVGSGNLETRDFDQAGFSRLVIANAFEVEVVREDDHSISITLDDNLFEFLECEQKGDTLHIGMQPGQNYARVTRKATIALPGIESLALSGASKGKISGFSSPHPLQLELSGGSSLDLADMESGKTGLVLSGASGITGSINATDVALDISGASSVKLEGSGDNAEIKSSGSSDVNLKDFPLLHADASLSGASDGFINVSSTLKARLSGASDLYYTGDPEIETADVTGGSTLGKR